MFDSYLPYDPTSVPPSTYGVPTGPLLDTYQPLSMPSLVSENDKTLETSSVTTSFEAPNTYITPVSPHLTNNGPPQVLHYFLLECHSNYCTCLKVKTIKRRFLPGNITHVHFAPSLRHLLHYRGRYLMLPLMPPPWGNIGGTREAGGRTTPTSLFTLICFHKRGYNW